DAEARLLRSAEHLDLDALVPPQGIEEPLAIARVPDRRGRDGHDARPLAVRRVAREEPMDGLEGLGDGAPGQRAGGAPPETGRDALLGENAESGDRPDLREEKSNRGRAEIDDGDQVRWRGGIRANFIRS